MIRNKLKFISILSLFAILLLLGTVGISASDTNNSLSVGVISRIPERPYSEINTHKYDGLKLYVGGMPFGVKFLTEGVIVTGFNEAATGGAQSPAKEAGLRCGDIILSVDGNRITSAAELNEIIGSGSGKALTVIYSRNGKELSVRIKPIFSKNEGKYTTGVYVRDSGAGIGTVTFIAPKSQAFGGLGHGICDGETGQLIPMERGSVVDVKINGIVKGLSGSPGEVKGYFSSGKTGTLLKNTDCGVYGVLASLPDEIQGKPMEIGTRGFVREGKAYVYSMLDSSRVEKYEVEISDIQRQATGNKCFTVKVTDKRLLDKTGGIIQGMSGSPIVQNGKLIGAVTHVLINDPTTGYGIFIENMLAQMGDLAG